ncbi:VTT domain-containing protein [Maricaulis sp.]|uniref:TVP38/TMEM64 family protein n=1 Tax=Maricaulis sp. TaxID=1486257 RepID=UPI0025C0DA46|nr:VTT domain-containing protein [Maricaulis sp.]
MIGAELVATLRRHPGKAVLAVGLVALFSLGGFAALLLPQDVTRQALDGLALAGREPWAPPLAILAFMALITLGAPQAVLIAALVAAFGPWAGFFYSWTGKVLACGLGFLVGRRAGAGWLARNAGPDVAIVMDELARHGFWASAVIRMVPTLPSIIINIAAGCTQMRFRAFIAGTALGSIPKMALIAFASHAAIQGLEGGGIRAWMAVGGAVLLLVLIAVIGRRWLARRATEGRAAKPV